MTKLYQNPLFDTIKNYFKQGNSDSIIYIFAPYIKTSILEKLLKDIPNRVIVVTTWKPRDIQFGSSELTLYPFCRQQNIALYISEKLHLKMYSVGLNDSILATGNVSNRGLLPNGNYEAATIIESLDISDQLFLKRIQKEARLVDDEMYEEYKQWSEQNEIEPSEDLSMDDIIPPPKKNDFSIASLPMTRSVDELISGYQKITDGQEPSIDEETSECIIHDLDNYNITLGLSKDEFVVSLTAAFFLHPFIQQLDKQINPKAQFGEIKAWIQNRCTDVPVPSRRQLTGNVQVLLEWFERLGDGKYVVDVPGRRSQRIRKVE